MDPIFWSISLLAAGFLIIGLEMFVPSAGMLGIAAAICLISGIVAAFTHSLGAGAVALLITVIAVPILLAFMVQIWPHTPLGRRILLGKATADDVMPKSEHYTEFKSLVGQLGVAKTKMLPSGIVLIAGRKYDALSDGFAIEAGQAVKVTAVKGTRIIVQPYDGDITDPGELPVRDRDVLSQPLEELGLEELDLDGFEET